MPRFSKIAKKSKIRANKTAGDDKKRKTPTNEDDVILSEPAAPKVPKQKTLTINELTPQALNVPPPVEGKGKEKLVEPPRPPKKPRHTKDPSTLVPPVTAPEADQKKTLKTQFLAELHSTAGDAGLTMATDYTKWLAQCMTSVASEVWDRLKTDQPNPLLSFGLMSSFIVSILTFDLFVFSLYNHHLLTSQLHFSVLYEHASVPHQCPDAIGFSEF